MSKFCKKICVLGVFVLLCATIIGIPKNGEHPPLLGSISSSVLL
ncbi:hypothetical protein [Clostridium subterminale]|uniref:Uncharacterized protein n=1 Tax=Clostridium subterminale TaxID=1550 RepID=A0ABP3VZU5_CLOSU